MGRVVGLSALGDFQEGHRLHPPLLGSGVFDGQRRHRRAGQGFHAAGKGDLQALPNNLIPCRAASKHRVSLGGGADEAAAAFVQQIELRPGLGSGFGIEAGGLHSPMRKIPLPISVQHPGGAAAIQSVGVRRQAGPGGAADGMKRRFVLARRGVFLSPGRLGGRAFQQQVALGFGFRRGHKGPHQHVVPQGVAQGAQDHPLMVGHVAFHDLRRGADALGCVVHRFEQAMFVRPAKLLHPFQVFRRRPGEEGQGQHGSIRRDDRARRFRAAGQSGQTEGAVLVIQFGVKGGVPAFAYAEGPVGMVAHLGADGVQGAFSQQRAGGQRQQEIGHQVFKHRAAPAQQRRPAACSRDGPVQPQPVLPFDLSRHDRQIGGQAGYAGQGVVVRGGGALFLRLPADVKQLGFPVVQRAEIRQPGQRVQPGGQVSVLFRQLIQMISADLGAAKQTGGQVAAVHRGHEPGR